MSELVSTKIRGPTEKKNVVALSEFVLTHSKLADSTLTTARPRRRTGTEVPGVPGVLARASTPDRK